MNWVSAPEASRERCSKKLYNMGGFYRQEGGGNIISKRKERIVLGKVIFSEGN